MLITTGDPNDYDIEQWKQPCMMFSLQEAAPLVLESNSVDKCRLTWTGRIVGCTLAKAMSTLEAMLRKLST